MVFEFPPWELKTPIFVNQDYPDSREWEKGYWAWNPSLMNRRIVGWWVGLKIDVKEEFLDDRNVIQEWIKSKYNDTLER